MIEVLNYINDNIGFIGFIIITMLLMGSLFFALDLWHIFDIRRKKQDPPEDDLDDFEF